MAFSKKEIIEIRQIMLKKALQCAISVGMRRTSLEVLTEDAGIAKGSFYRFFPSKELLYLDVLKNIEQEAYMAANQEAKRNKDIPPFECASIMILAACDHLYASGVIPFIEKDVNYPLSRIPDAAQKDHEEQYKRHIQELLETVQLQPNCSFELAVASIRLLILTILHREKIRGLYPSALKVIVRGACRELFD